MSKHALNENPPTYSAFFPVFPSFRSSSFSFFFYSFHSIHHVEFRVAFLFPVVFLSFSFLARFSRSLDYLSFLFNILRWRWTVNVPTRWRLVFHWNKFPLVSRELYALESVSSFRDKIIKPIRFLLERNWRLGLIISHETKEFIGIFLLIIFFLEKRII